MKEDTKVKFYQFLVGKIGIAEFEKWIYSNSSLEIEIGENSYMDLISFDFKDKSANEILKVFISEIVQIGDFEKWKITNKLREFIDSPERTKDLLNDLYLLFSGLPNDNSNEPKGYKFLQNLGLNYLHWMDEDYLKTCHGDKWTDYYEKYEKEIPLYYKQLVPIARLILSAFQKAEIEIINKGQYVISDSLKEQLESDKVFELRH